MENKSGLFAGNILLFYSYDIGEEVDLAEIKRKDLLPVRTVSLSPYFKNYHTPLFFQMPKDVDGIGDSDCISSKVHHFGVISFIYRIPFKASFEELERNLIHTCELYNKKNEQDAKFVYDRILQTIRNPKFFSLKNFYFVIQMNLQQTTPDTFIEKYGSKIASLLRLETQNLSEYQKDDILSYTTGYYGQDFIIIDSQASFVYDDEYFELLEFFESAAIQKLELQYYDRTLNEKLNYFYKQGSFKLPRRAYVPIIGRWTDLPISSLAKIRVDISVIIEQLQNSINMVGDPYYSRLYSMLINKLSLQEWKDSINRKLKIVNDIYTIYQDHLDMVHQEILTLVIIVLIAYEAFGRFL